MKNDVKNHNKTKDNVDEYVEERKNELMGEILKFKYISRVGKETVLDNFIRQIINDRKVRVSREWINLQCAEIVSEIVDKGAGNLGILQALELMLPVAFEEAGVEVED